MPRTEEQRRAARNQTSSGPRAMSWTSPMVLGAAAVVLIVAGLAVGWALLGGSGPTPGGTAQQGPGVSPQLEALRREVEREDVPIPTLLAFAHQALDEQQIAPAIWAYKRALGREPKNPEALVHMGSILFMTGHVDQALANMAEALRADPKYAHAYWDRAHILFNAKHDYKGAIADFQTFLEIIPTGQDADRARAMIGEAQRLAATQPAAAPSPPGTTTPRAPAAEGVAAAPPHPPGRGGAPSAARATAASPASPSGAPSGSGTPETFTFKSLGEMRKGLEASGGS